jgi:hypothetical protein
VEAELTISAIVYGVGQFKISNAHDQITGMDSSSLPLGILDSNPAFLVVILRIPSRLIWTYTVSVL